jgi:hypothetical protein
MPKTLSPVVARYNTRLQKGAALLEDMRLLVRSWEDGPVKDFGILEGRAHKRLASVRLPVGAMAYIRQYQSHRRT